MIKALIFDMDGVIVDTAKLHYQAWKQEVKKIGINYSEKENAKLKGLPRLATLKGILKAYNKHDIHADQLNDIANNKNTFYLKMLEEKMSKQDILPGIEKLLKAARKLHLKIAIASSSHSATFIVKKIGLQDYFDYIVNPQKIKNGKPSPDIYIAAAKGLKVDPSECIGFEDAINGIKGLNEANIFSVAITHNDEGPWHKALYVVAKTNELNLKTILQLTK